MRKHLTCPMCGGKSPIHVLPVKMPECLYEHLREAAKGMSQQRAVSVADLMRHGAVILCHNLALILPLQSTNTTKCQRCGKDWSHRTVTRLLTVAELEGYYCGRGCPNCKEG